MLTSISPQSCIAACSTSPRTTAFSSVFDAITGERVYQQRLGDGTTGFTASLVAADCKVYFTSEDGDVFVVKAGREFELMAKNPAGRHRHGTPAMSEGTLYFRTGGAVIAVR